MITHNDYSRMIANYDADIAAGRDPGITPYGLQVYRNQQLGFLPCPEVLIPSRMRMRMELPQGRFQRVEHREDDAAVIAAQRARVEAWTARSHVTPPPPDDNTPAHRVCSICAGDDVGSLNVAGSIFKCMCVDEEYMLVCPACRAKLDRCPYCRTEGDVLPDSDADASWAHVLSRVSNLIERLVSHEDNEEPSNAISHDGEERVRSRRISTFVPQHSTQQRDAARAPRTALRAVQYMRR
jgi:hypothetical protein